MDEYYLPRSGDDIDLVDIAISRHPSYTHFLNIEKERIVGMTDELEAMRQAVYLRLLIPKGKYPIYSRNYGSELYTLVGKPIPYAMSEAKRMINDALTADDRITLTSGFNFKRGKGTLLTSYTVKTIFGDLEAETVITI